MNKELKVAIKAAQAAGQILLKFYNKNLKKINLINMMHLKDQKILSVIFIISWLRVAHGKY
jgi:hypothetical protein